MSSLVKLIVELAANSAAFQNDMRRAADVAQRNMERIQEQGRATHKALDSLAAGAKSLVVGFAAGAGIATFAKSLGSAAIEAEGLQKKLQFATGSVQSAQSAMRFASETANELGLSAASAATGFATIAAAARGTALEGQAARDIFLGISQAAAALNLSASDTEGALLAISQMISKGTVSAEELRGQLGERLPGAFQLAANAMGVTTAELGKMLEKGQVAATEFLPKFALEMQNAFGAASQDAANGLASSMNRLENAWESLLVAIADTGAISGAANLFGNLARDIERATNWIDSFRSAQNRMRSEGISEDMLAKSRELLKLQADMGKMQSGPQLSGWAGGAQREAIEKQKAAISELRGEYDALRQRYEQLTAPAKEVTINITKVGMAAGEAAGNKKALGRAVKDAGREAAQFASKLQALKDQLDPLGRATRQYEEDLALLRAGIKDADELTLLTAAATDKFIESTFPLSGIAQHIRKVADEYRAVEDNIQKVQEVFDPVAKAMENAFDRLDNTMASVWKGIIDGSRNAFDLLKEFALSTLAEIIHAFTTQRIVLSLGAAFGMGGTGQSLAGTGTQAIGSLAQGGGFLSNIGSLFSSNAAGMSLARGAFALSDVVSPYSSTAAGGLFNLGRGASFLNTGTLLGAGIAGYGGSLLADLAFGKNRGIGATIGSGAGGLAGGLAGTAVAGASGAAIGAMAGSVVPIVGTLIGAFLGSALGGLFGRTPVPPQGRLLTASERFGPRGGGVDQALFAWNKAAAGPFGFVGLENIDTKGDFKIEPFKAWFDQITQIDQQISTLIGPEDTRRVAQAMDGWRSTFQKGALDTARFVEERLAAIAQTIAGGFAPLIDVAGEGAEQFLQRLGVLSQSRLALGIPRFEEMVSRLSPLMAVAGEGVEQVAARVQALTAITQALSADPFAEFARSVEEGSLTLWEAAGRQRDALLDLASSYDGSIAATQSLAAATQAGYQTILQVMAQIHQARASIDQMLSTQAQQLRDFGLSDESKLARSAREAQGLFDTLGSLIDPAKIQQTATDLGRLVGEIFGLLPEAVEQVAAPARGLAERFLNPAAFLEEAEEQAKGFREFIKDALGFDPRDLGIETKEQAGQALADFLDQANARAREQLNVAEEQTRANAETLREAIRSEMAAAAAEFRAAAEVQQKAAQVQLRAANTPVEVKADVTFNGVPAGTLGIV